MTQKTDPFISLSWGWSSGEDGWGTGLNNNLITYAFFLNTRFDGSIATTASLPVSPINGQAYFVTTENTFYFRADGVWYSTVPPVGKTFILKSTEAVYKFTGGSLVLDTKPISDVTGLQAALDSKVDDSQVGAASGVAPLGADSKVPSEYLPENGSYKGTWNATTNTPNIVSGTGTNGDFYRVSIGGTTTIDGVSSWSIGDEIRFNGTVWQRIPNTGGVSSVNGATGSVVLIAADVGATPTSHIGSGGSQHADATTSVSGFFTPSEKIKLSGIATNATANQTDSFLLSRANHTGTQAQSTITNLTTDLSSKQATLVSGTNIKTINGASILGSGDIVISGGGGGTTFTALTDTPSSYVSNASKVTRVKLDESGLEFVSIGTAAFNNTGDFATASHTHADATTSLSGFMAAADKIKLNGIASNATANQTDSYLLSRSNHTGSQSYTTITGLATVASSGSATDLSTGTLADARLPFTISAKTFSGKINFAYTSTLGNLETESAFEIYNPSSGATKLTAGVANIENISYIQSMFAGVSYAGRPLAIQPFGGEVLIGKTLSNSSAKLQIQGDATVSGSSTTGQLIAISNQGTTPNYSVAQILVSDNGSNNPVSIGFWRVGTTAVQLIHRSNDLLELFGATYGNYADFSAKVITSSGGFVGNGSSLSALNASNITSGTLADARLPSTMSAKVFPQVTVSASVPTITMSSTTVAVAGMSNYISFRDNTSSEVGWIGYGSGNGEIGISNSSRIVRILSPLILNSTITGDGSGLTNLNASNLTSGTVSNSRLTSASTSVAGVVQLVDSTSNTSTTTAATPNSVKITYDLASAANADRLKWDGGATGLVASTGRTSLGLVAIASSGSATDLVSGVVDNARLNTASTSGAGIVQLTTSLSSTSTTLAPTASALKTVSDLVNTVSALQDDLYEAPYQKLNARGSISGAQSISNAAGTHVTATATGNITWTFPSVGSTDALALTLELTNGGAFTMTWPAGTRWAGGVAPTLTASGTDVLVFTKAGTANWRGYLSSKDNK